MLTNIPYVQHWLGDAVADGLADYLKTEVKIGRVQVGLFNRLVVDDVYLYDQQDSLMLQATRVAAKVDLLPLVNGKIRINNAQLFGSHIHIYQNKENSPLNCQFLIDAFKPKDETNKKPIDLQISSLLIRRCETRFDQYFQPETPGKLNIHHLDIKEMSMTAAISYCTPDSQSIYLKHLSFKEKSGLELKNLAFDANSTKKSLNLSDFVLEMPSTNIKMPYFTSDFKGYPNKQNIRTWLSEANIATALDVQVTPSDIASVIPKISNFKDKINLKSTLKYDKGLLQASNITLNNEEKSLLLQGSAVVSHITDKPNCHLDIDRLSLSGKLQNFITRNLTGTEKEISPILSQLGTTETMGSIIYHDKKLTAELETRTQYGNITLNGDLADKNHIDATAKLQSFKLNNLLQNNNKVNISDVTLEASVQGDIKAKDGNPDLTCKATIQQIDYNNYVYRNVLANATYKSKRLDGQLELDDTNGSVHFNGQADMSSAKKHITGALAVQSFSPYKMNLTKKRPDERYSGNIDADISFTNVDDINGQLNIHNLEIAKEGVDTIPVGDCLVNCTYDEGSRHITIDSEPLKMSAEGTFKWKDLGNTFLSITHNHLPSIFKNPKAKPSQDTDLKFSINLQDTVLFTKLANTSIKIPEVATLQGEMNSITNEISFKADVPQLLIANQDLRHVGCTMTSNKEIIQTSLVADRMTKGKPVAINLDAFANEDKLNTRLRWSNNTTPLQEGNIYVTGHLHKDLSGDQAILGMINASTIIINDTTWTVSPAYVNYHDKIIDIENLRISNEDRHITLNGRVSKEETDTLTADLKDINLGYIYGFANFHSVEFDGLATGRAYAYGLLKNPVANIFMHVDNFTFNDASMGEMDVYGNYGSHGKNITLSAMIKDAKLNSQTSIDGTITPGKNPQGSLELMIKPQRINIAFLNKYTNKFFRNMQGNASGWVRVFGHFKDVNLEGALQVDDAKMHVLSLGVDYHTTKDSIIMIPDNIYIKNAIVYDPYGNPGSEDHYAKLDGHLMHRHLSHLSYNFNMDTNQMLGYNFNTFGDNKFYGTIYGTGQIHLFGEPGQVNVDVKCTPNKGSLIVYNATSPETITEAGFVNFVNHADTLNTAIIDTNAKQEEESATDMRLNFNLDITPDAEMRVIMDTKTGDFLNLFGNAHIIANYYNKGKFQMYGTYRVDHGLYKMSVQDFIHKDFKIQQNGTLIFGGDAYQAALNLKAAYTVPNVSLDDLASTGLGLSNTRVNCIMNIGGKAKEPLVTFDFELPNANEDEKQMIRSLISTEEEKNMQVIYLLGLGRFYSYENQYVGQGGQKSGMAVNSFLSNTLSNRVNQIMSNAMGTNSNWSFGTNLRTGENGWNRVDVEGLLSGRMLNNRLQINGNFGYRESMYTTNKSNFIGDFDILYLLNSRGTYALKAYNQTNDRYFTQSSLTTQGIGIQYKRDFNKWKEAFQRTHKRKDKK